MPDKRSPDKIIDSAGGPAPPRDDDAPGPDGTAPDPDDQSAGAIVRRVRRAVHDLRQPVQAMRLFVHLLSTRLEREQDRALVVKLDEALENIDVELRGLMASVVPASDKAAAPVDPSASETADKP
jgi:hypothetical protein